MTNPQSLERARDSRAHALMLRRHLLGLGVEVKDLLDPLCGDPLGVLYKTKHINLSHYNLGLRYRNAALLYRQLNGLPSGLPKPIGTHGLSHYEVTPEAWQRIKARYLLYQRLVLKRAGVAALRVVNQICVSEQMILAEEIPDLRRGLQAIVNARKLAALSDSDLTALRLGG